MHKLFVGEGAIATYYWPRYIFSVNVKNPNNIYVKINKIISKSGISLEDGSMGVRFVTNAIIIHTYIVRPVKK